LIKKCDLFNQKGVVVRIDRDNLRSSNISLIYYPKYGLFTYKLCADGSKVGDIIENGNLFEKGSSFFLKDIPISSNIYNIEKYPGGGGVYARAAGTSGTVIRKFKNSVGENFVGVRLPSGKQLYLNNECIASLGRCSNIKHKMFKFGKFGIKKRLGLKSKVRGVAMNPIDHPHGGGEGKTSGGRLSVSLWGRLTKGFKTEKLKRFSKLHKIYKRINKIGSVKYE